MPSSGQIVHSRLSEPAAARRLDDEAVARLQRRPRPSRSASRSCRRCARPSCGPAARRRRPSIPRGGDAAAVGEDVGAHRLEERDRADHPVAAADARPAPPEPRRIANCVEPHRQPRFEDLRDRSAGCWSCASAPRSSRHDPARRPSRRRSSHNIGGASLPKVKLFIVPWLGASRPVAANKASVTTWLVSTLPATTAAG